jgi:hypothetical protein
MFSGAIALSDGTADNKNQQSLLQGKRPNMLMKKVLVVLILGMISAGCNTSQKSENQSVADSTAVDSTAIVPQKDSLGVFLPDLKTNQSLPEAQEVTPFFIKKSVTKPFHCRQFWINFCLPIKTWTSNRPKLCLSAKTVIILRCCWKRY